MPQEPRKARRRVMHRSVAAGALLAMILAAIIPGEASAQRILIDNMGGRSTPLKQVRQVATRLVADTATVEAGVPFRLGVVFKIQPEWHIYWRYAGEVGLPPEISWELPEGFTVGELQWPNPFRLDDEYELTSYTYEDEVMLFVDVTPPARLDKGAPLKFSMSADYLVCKIQCIPESSKDELELRVGAAEPSADAGLFEKYSAGVPVEPAQVADMISLDLGTPVPAFAGGSASLRVTIKGEAPWAVIPGDGHGRTELFPDGSLVEVTHPTRTPSYEEAAGAGDEPVDSISFEWMAEIEYETGPGRLSIASALRISVVNSETGERRELNLNLDQSVTVVGAVISDAAAGAGAAAEPAGSGSPGAGTEGIAPETSAGAAASEEFDFWEAREPEPERSLLWFLLLAFVGGLILNVMPCVLPVLSIKILSFVNQAGEDPRRVLRLGLVFAAGVFASFAVLATFVVVLKAAGAQVGWGFQLQEPRFLIFISAVLLAFGLSLLGVFEIELPGAVRNVEGLQRREGPVGAFFNGVLATLLATPCTAPLLGPALGFAFSRPAPQIYLFFFTIAAGLASPYVFLSARPGWLKFVPKPGEWMNVFKQSMGLLLIATVIWLLWVLGQMAGADGMVASMWFLLAVAVGCWMIGFTSSPRATRRRRIALPIAALVLAGSVYALLPEQYLRSLDARLEAGEASTITATETEMHGGIAWRPFSVALVNELAAQNKTIFVDFTADWCFTCKVNEKVVLHTKAIAEAFTEHGVVALMADYTRKQDGLTRILNKFGRAGVPMYVIFPAGRPQDYILLPEVLTTSMVKARLAEAAAPRS